MAVTVKVAVWPVATVWSAGCVVMAGGSWTVSAAAFDVTVPTAFETTQVNCAPLSEMVVAGVV